MISTKRTNKAYMSLVITGLIAVVGSFVGLRLSLTSNTGPTESEASEVPNGIYSSSNSNWAEDDTNYFTQWKCSSNIGINKIYKLNILPQGQHTDTIWKDSLYADFQDMVGNNPTIQYTIGDLFDPPAYSFYMQKATYNTVLNKWDITDVLKNPPPKGGVSSFDGSNSDYIMNEYLIPGWGPTANKPGSKSKIPGVSETTSSTNYSKYNGNVGYPLWGTGDLGLTTIREKIIDSGWSDSNTNTCIHMNPTLFDYDSTGSPKSFAAFMFTTKPEKGCTLPNGQELEPGFYVYHFVNNTLGWQLDLNAGLLDKAQAINYIWGSTKKFVTDEWDGKIQIADLNQSVPRHPKTVLDCSEGNVYITESSGKENIFYFLADPEPYVYKTATQNLPIHDIYVAFSDKPQPVNLIGNFDNTSCTSMSGWAGNKNNPSTPVDIHLYADGIQSSNLFAYFKANIPREIAVCDVIGSSENPCNHGFSYNTPEFLKDGKNHVIDGYAVNEKGESYKLSGSGKTINCSGSSSQTKVNVDLNKSGNVDMSDYVLFNKYYSKNDKRADLNGNGVVEISDFKLFRTKYLEQSK